MLLDLTDSLGYKEVLRPWLEDRRSKSFPDPTKKGLTEKKFLYRAITASLFKKVIAEMLKYLEDEVPMRYKQLKEKEKGKEKSFEIGR